MHPCVLDTFRTEFPLLFEKPGALFCFDPSKPVGKGTI